MNPAHDTISELAAVTAEMAAMSDLASARFNDLLAMRGTLIKRLAGNQLEGSGVDFDDTRLASIIENAAILQDRLQNRADSIRTELSRLQPARLLVAAVRSTFIAPEPNGVDLSA